MPGVRTPSTPARSASTYRAHWKDELKRRHIRAVCIRSHSRAEAPGVRLFACAARRPGTGAAPLWRRDVDSLADVAAAVERLRVDEPPGTGVGARATSR